MYITVCVNDVCVWSPLLRLWQVKRGLAFLDICHVFRFRMFALRLGDIFSPDWLQFCVLIIIQFIIHFVFFLHSDWSVSDTMCRFKCLYLQPPGGAAAASSPQLHKRDNIRFTLYGFTSKKKTITCRPTLTLRLFIYVKRSGYIHSLQSKVHIK